ncbi:hypothetical protein [Aureimonas sp. AU4]|uniref:hypothetical protein n=1 Tax=Aureimonas sp. AU4 TaxID=1638163 RepID=UPI000784A049|nr:hypothetical protein [Aureimonas sp. AU4]
MTVITFPPERRSARADREARTAPAARGTGRSEGAWCDERARLRLLAALQRSLVEGLLRESPAAGSVLSALR